MLKMQPLERIGDRYYDLPLVSSCFGIQNIDKMSFRKPYQPRHEKTGISPMRKKAQISCAVTVQLISAFVFATRIIQLNYYRYPNFPASKLYRSLCVGAGRNPRKPGFSRRGSCDSQENLASPNERRITVLM